MRQVSYTSLGWRFTFPEPCINHKLLFTVVDVFAFPVPERLMGLTKQDTGWTDEGKIGSAKKRSVGLSKDGLV